jgi:hypothetical protein
VFAAIQDNYNQYLPQIIINMRFNLTIMYFGYDGYIAYVSQRSPNRGAEPIITHHWESTAFVHTQNFMRTLYPTNNARLSEQGQ